jgi:hypothetical protein
MDAGSIPAASTIRLARFARPFLSFPFMTLSADDFVPGVLGASARRKPILREVR